MADRPTEPDQEAADRDAAHAELDRKILRGSLWVALSYGGGQVLSIVSMLVLVRLLEPSAFGVMAIAWTFLYIATSIQEGGAGAALIHRRHDIEQAAASVLLFTPLSGALLYLVTFLLAPYAAGWFDSPELTDVLRVLAIMVPIGSLAVVPVSLLEREMRFKALAQIKLVIAPAQFVTAIGLAVAGAGVWSLVGGQLVASTIGLVLAWRHTPFVPSPALASMSMLRDVLRYGRYVTAQNLLNIGATTLDNITIARMLGTTSLGFYQIAFRLSELPNVVIGHVVGRTMFSAYSSVQHDLAWAGRAYVQNLQRIGLFALPASVALLVAGEPIVVAVLGEKWRASVEPLQILAAYGLVRSFAAPAAELFKGLGKPWLNVIIGSVYVALIVPLVVALAGKFDLVGAALAMLVLQVVIGLPMVGIALRIVKLPLTYLLRQLAPMVVCAALMAGTMVVFTMATTELSPIPRLLAIVVPGLLVYVVGTALLARGVIAPMWAALRRAAPATPQPVAPLEAPHLAAFDASFPAGWLPGPDRATSIRFQRRSIQLLPGRLLLGGILAGFLLLNLAVAVGLALGQLLPAVVLVAAPIVLAAFGALTAQYRHWLLYAALAANLSTIALFDDPLPLPGGTQIFLTDVIAVLALASFVAAVLIAPPEERPRVPRTPVLGWALVPLLVFVALGVWRGHERYGASLVGQPFRLILYAGIAVALTTVTARQAYKAITVIFYVGTVWQALQAVQLMATGGTQTDTATLSTGGTRVLALGTAMYLTGALVLALLNLELDELAGRRALHLAIAGLALFGIVVAFGRTTFAAVAFIVPVLIFAFQRLRRALVDWLPLIVPVVALCVLGVSLVAPTVGPTLKERLTASTTDDFNVRWRQEASRATLEGVDDEPLLGVGFGRPSEFEIDRFRFEIQGDPHNSYVYLLAGGGILTLASFIVLMIVYLWDAWRRFRGAEGVERALVAFAVSFWLVFVINALAGPVLSDASFLLTIWILMTLPALVPLRPARTRATVPEPAASPA